MADGVCVTFAHQTQHGRTALNVAAYFGRTDCVRLLLEVGAEKDAKDHVRGMMQRFHVPSKATSRVGISGVCLCNVTLLSFVCVYVCVSVSVCVSECFCHTSSDLYHMQIVNIFEFCSLLFDLSFNAFLNFVCS